MKSALLSAVDLAQHRQSSSAADLSSTSPSALSRGRSAPNVADAASLRQRSRSASRQSLISSSGGGGGGGGGSASTPDGTAAANAAPAAAATSSGTASSHHLSVSPSLVSLSLATPLPPATPPPPPRHMRLVPSTSTSTMINDPRADSVTVPLLLSPTLSDHPTRDLMENTDNKEEEDVLRQPSMRQKLAFYLDTSRTGRLVDLVDAVLSFAQCALYVANTTFAAPPISPLAAQTQTRPLFRSLDQEPIPFAQALVQVLGAGPGNTSPASVDESYRAASRRANAIPLPVAIILTELTLAGLILAMWTFRFLVSPSRVSFLGSTYCFLSLVSSIPVFVAYAWAYQDWHIYFSYMSAGPVVYAFPIRWPRFHEVLEVVLKPVKDPLINLSAIGRKAATVASAVLFTLLTVAAMIHITLYKDERQDVRQSSFFDVLYFTVMSSTSGLSTSISADSWSTRALLLGIMVAGAFYLPGAISDLLTMLRSRSKFTRPYASTGNLHVIVMGSLDTGSVTTFLREILCEDHGPATTFTTVLFLSPDEPSDALIDVFADPAYATRVQYVKGSATSFRDLEQCRAKEARAVFILQSKLASSTGDPLADDAEAAMRALSVKKYAPNVPIFCQVSMPDNVQQFQYLADSVMCLDELALGILAQSARVPGFAAIVSLLSSSMTDGQRQSLVQLAEAQDLHFLKPYIRGCSQEIYTCRLPASLVGRSFAEAARLVYVHFGMCMIALGSPVHGSGTGGGVPANMRFHIVLNPAAHGITGVEHAFLIGAESDLVTKLATFDFAAYPVPMPTSTPHVQQPMFNLEVMDENVGPAAASMPSILPLGGSSVPLGGGSARALLDAAAVMDTSPGNEDDDDEDGDEGDADVDRGASIMDPSLSRFTSLSDTTLGTHPKPSATAARKFATGSLLNKSCGPTTTTVSIDSDTLSPDVTHHLILCDAALERGQLPRHLDLFIGPLRDHRLPRHTPIVILSADDPPECVQEYPNVHYICGNPLKRGDLLRAGVARASRLVILSSVKSERRVVDAGAVLIALNAESAGSKAFPVIEFVHTNNFKFVSESYVLRGVRDPYLEIITRPSFMAGHVFASTLLDGILAQAFYSPHSLALLNRLVFPGQASEIERSSASILPAQNVSVNQVALPVHLVGMTYQDLFIEQSAVGNGTVVMGIYRRILCNGDRPLSLTLVNPRPKMILRASDRVFVLRPGVH
ncbi:hypothetical protein BC828DRAFT_382621 [Blastocladiella britannica]|nr:hypothetical protein BC828DRAFT_382621 [Blastocladiella britannica]